MSTEIMSSMTDPLTQSRLTELELENKRLREQLKAYEAKYGPLNCEASSTAGPATTATDCSGGDVLRTMRAKVMAEKEAAAAKFLALMGNYQKLLKGHDEEQQQQPASTEETFSIPSALNTQETDVSIDSPSSSTPISPQ